MEIIKVVLTGGPCAGKTTALNSIREYLAINNIPCITVPETATELILNGMPFNAKLTYMFQSLVLKKQISKEIISEDYAKIFYNACDKCVIIYDRGILDNKAYLNDKNEFNELLNKYNLSEIEVLDEYDLVLDLLSVASCKKEAYNLSNKARTEDADTAIKVDEKTSLAWIHHKNLKIINSSVSLEEETEIIIHYIKEILNGIQTKEVRKFFVNDKYSDYSRYNKDNSEELYITDYFLEGEDNSYNYVISKREHNNHASYVYSVYKEENGKTIILHDKKITKEEFFKLIIEYNIINKVERREINFIQNKQKFKLCFYDNYTTLEFEENKLNENLILPDNLSIIGEVLDKSSKECKNNKIRVRVAI